MKRVSEYKFIILAALLIISLSAFSFVAYKKVRSFCTVTNECCKAPQTNQSGELLWDVLTHQFAQANVTK